MISSHLPSRERDRQHAVLETVIREDVGKRRRDDRAKAELAERPWRMFARRSAAEILAGNEY